MAMETLKGARKRWWRETREIMTFAVPSLIVVIAFIAWLIGFLGHYFLEANVGEYDTDAWQVVLINFPYWLRALCLLPLGIMLMVPVIVSNNRWFPTSESVEHDNNMRRAYGERD